MMTDEQMAEKLLRGLLVLPPWQVEHVLDGSIAALAAAILHFNPHATEEQIQERCERVASLVRARYQMATEANAGLGQIH